MALEPEGRIRTLVKLRGLQVPMPLWTGLWIFSVFILHLGYLSTESGVLCMQQTEAHV